MRGGISVNIQKRTTISILKALVVLLLLCSFTNSVYAGMDFGTKPTISLGVPTESAGFFNFDSATVSGSEDNVQAILINFTENITNGDAITLPIVDGFTEASDSTAYSKRITVVGKNDTAVSDYIRGIKFAVAGEKQGVGIVVATHDINVNTFYNSETQHYYQYIPFTNEDDRRDWTVAYDDAKSKRYRGRTGYLATVTSKNEDVFLNKVSGGKCGWLGGTLVTNYGANGTLHYMGFNTEKNVANINADGWYWANGPEIGQVFYKTKSLYPNADITNASNQDDLSNGLYFNWARGTVSYEPNNRTIDGAECPDDDYEAYLTTLEVGGNSGKQGTSFSWNDKANNGTQVFSGLSEWNVRGYFIEFGDLTVGNTPVEVSSSEMAIGILDNTAPTLTAGAVSRTSDTSGTVRFTSNEAGSYHYAVVADGAGEPVIDTNGAGTACTTAETTITNPTGLTTGVKDIYIKVKDASNNVSTALKIDINAYVAPYNPAPAPASTPTPIPTPMPTPTPDTGVIIIVNGQTETAATSTTTQEGDRTVTTITVDDKKVEEKLKTEGNNATVTIPVKNDAVTVVGQLNGQTVKNMENKEAVLEIKTENVSYTIPASQINIDNISEQIGKQVELKDIKVNVTISTPTQDTVKIVENTAQKNNYQVVVKPVDFEISCTSRDKTVEVSKFKGYVERTVAIPDGIDPGRITTGIVLNADGTFSHVPTTIMTIDGKYHAKINSLTNSTYSVIYNPKTFKDVENHWARDAVDDMGSRLIVSGTGNDMFEPDKEITRGEFAAIVVRTLGLMRSGTGKAYFSDVSDNNGYYNAISIAYEYGIISGYGNSKFGPADKITREQAMLMIARAMKITGLEMDINENETNSLLADYTDGTAASDYAKASMAACLKAGVIIGGNDRTIAPKSDITRAEVAVIVQRLLKKSELI